MSIRNKNIFVIILLCVMIYLFYSQINSVTQRNELTFSDFLRLSQQGNVESVRIKENIAYVATSQGEFKTVIPTGFDQLPEILYGYDVSFKYEKAESNSLVMMMISSWLPVLLIIGVMLFFSKQLQSGGNKILGFGKFKPRVPNQNDTPTTLKDVAGIDEAIEEVEEIVSYLKDNKKFVEIGGRVPTGVILTGKPGTGKTLLAKAIAGEANAPFFNISGSDFVEMFVGVGASRVRDLFTQARENSPCIVYIDEIDAVGRQRGSGLGGGNDEREQTLNQLLVEMDGFNGNEGVIILASTNRPDVLDPALTRPGRFDRQIVIPPPDLLGREKILKIHTKDVALADQVDLKKLATTTIGFTGADLANLVNEAALLAGRVKKDSVDYEAFEQARDKILMGTERKTFTMKEDEKKSTSYHEAGHALINTICTTQDPVHKVTIIPRGQALGVTMMAPTKEKIHQSKKYLMETLEVLMGGRAAEEIVFNQFTTGASNDLERATDLAHRMICSWGMNDNIGPVYLSDSNSDVFLGQEMMTEKRVSNKLAEMVDIEVKKTVNNAYSSVIKKLKSNMDSLHKIAEKLLQEETIDGAAVREIIFGTTQTEKTA